MAIIATIRCRHIKAAVEFYTKVLDFHLADKDELIDPAHVVLRRAGDAIFLSSHAGDGPFGTHTAVMTEGIDALFAKFLGQGLVPPEQKGPLHHGPIEQSWGTREFAVDDPDGNSLYFIQEPR